MEFRTLLVDSPYLFKRSLYGAKDQYTTNFGNFGGVYGFLTMIRKLIKEHSINKVVLVWDGENSGKARYLIDHNYKANRENKEWYNKIELTDAQIKREEDKEISVLNQKIRIQKYAEELFFRQIEVDEIEADDLISQYCMDHHNNEDILVYTNDRDIAQLLDLNITILFGNINTPITRNNFSMFFKYHYSNVLTLKILTGDSSDNIKGISGLGEKTLLKQFSNLTFKHVTVNEICNEVIKINKVRKEEKKKPYKAFVTLLENIDVLTKNFKLINLKKPMLNDIAIEELKILDEPLDDSDRGSSNLFNLMKEDGFLEVYGYDFVSYVELFYPVIMKEKDTLKKYLKQIR
jgi:DNA polymerase-1